MSSEAWAPGSALPSARCCPHHSHSSREERLSRLPGSEAWLQHVAGGGLFVALPFGPSAHLLQFNPHGHAGRPRHGWMPLPGVHTLPHGLGAEWVWLWILALSWCPPVASRVPQTPVGSQVTPARTPARAWSQLLSKLISLLSVEFVFLVGV